MVLQGSWLLYGLFFSSAFLHFGIYESEIVRKMVLQGSWLFYGQFVFSGFWVNWEPASQNGIPKMGSPGRGACFRTQTLVLGIPQMGSPGRGACFRTHKLVFSIDRGSKNGFTRQGRLLPDTNTWTNVQRHFQNVG